MRVIVNLLKGVLIALLLSLLSTFGFSLIIKQFLPLILKDDIIIGLIVSYFVLGVDLLIWILCLWFFIYWGIKENEQTGHSPAIFSGIKLFYLISALTGLLFFIFYLW